MRKPAPDAIALLDADHVAILGLFQAYRELVRTHAPPLQRRALGEQICLELTIHSKLEQELVYPAMREALRDDDLVDEAEDQHGSQRELVAQILATPAGDELYDAKVTVLAEYVERHVRQEREQLFKHMLASQLDLQSLGRAIVVRREELRAVAEALREDALAYAIA